MKWRSLEESVRSTEVRPLRDIYAERKELIAKYVPAETQAVHALAAAPGHAVPFLADRLRPVPVVDARRVEKLLGDLDSERFAARDAATKELTEMGGQVEPALRRLPPIGVEQIGVLGQKIRSNLGVRKKEGGEFLREDVVRPHRIPHLA